ncbi:putative ribosomal-protein-alanine acetyltransferase [Halolactibacillus miurensis]|uniref:[Ribosomal protein bS18]-alanine N-acetyltransferase n=1 Tax=Halolactibacillus miurensis TaxID=306541 RepID=A0A1I6TVV2_9BACI|nr:MULTISPECIES: ribosomal protein S18-alanine N-acetyltransferase [Halolactibacillus]GEM05436.1 putative ribosomal-protein-alanine acetyltransferase [Halolactibacillus miurensis]SFS93316.1 ribosomal-protein-alanine N-acetyltransferase [Halolactibacillus miurensis]
MTVNMRLMRVEDLDVVAEIEKASFPTPWSRNIYREELTENNFAHYYVIENDQGVVGFIGAWIIFDEIQVTNFAVLPSERKKGYGRMLFQYLINKALLKGGRLMSLEVRKSNLAAQKIYQSFGLKKAGIRKRYYTDNNEDAIVMWVEL